MILLEVNNRIVEETLTVKIKYVLFDLMIFGKFLLLTQECLERTKA